MPLPEWRAQTGGRGVVVRLLRLVRDQREDLDVVEGGQEGVTVDPGHLDVVREVVRLTSGQGEVRLATGTVLEVSRQRLTPLMERLGET